MDSTLLGALIAATIAALVSCGVALWTSKQNRDLENKKILAIKKEELYRACIDFHHSMLLYLNATLSPLHRERSLYDKAGALKEESNGKIEIIINIYFNSIDISTVKKLAAEFEGRYVSIARRHFEEKNKDKDTPDNPLLNDIKFYDNASNAYDKLAESIKKLKKSVREIKIF
ncbi:TPA: hypothetical protein SMF67_003774 [Serratia marcescens]|uniref:hypothetical protein n=1 Tax=Serratia marcescens TaxID=615 RepID=UPI00131A5C57|nr:hypothetical protein [Serratia marcescens]MBH2835603.1 hypothetical protein [Serratia marcescens]HEJ7093073.1 hypothetical protein [Serratia marcescens]